MTKHKRKMTPLQFYGVAVRGLGASQVADTLKIGVRSIQRWMADPLYTSEDSQSASQLERLHRLFTKLDQVGMGYACRGAIRYLESALEEVGSQDIGQPLDTMHEEQLLDHKKLSDLHRLIDSQAPINQVRQARGELADEISRTIAKYIQDHE